MIEINGKNIIYTLPSKDNLGQVSPYLFIEKLGEKILMTWPQLLVICRANQGTHQIHCVLPRHFAHQQIRLIKVQIELIAVNLLDELKDKIHSAGLAS